MRMMMMLLLLPSHYHIDDNIDVLLLQSNSYLHNLYYLINKISIIPYTMTTLFNKSS